MSEKISFTEEEMSWIYSFMVMNATTMSKAIPHTALRKLLDCRQALMEIIEIGKRDMSNPKYDSYFEFAKEALKK